MAPDASDGQQATADSTSAADVAERIGEVLRAPFMLAGRAVMIAVSIGISDSHRDIANPQRLLAEADSAMYTAKRHSEGRYETYQVMGGAGSVV